VRKEKVIPIIIGAIGTISKSFQKIPEQHIGKSGFGGLEEACWPLVLKFAGSDPAEAVGFLGRKNL
jgi:hypothetical protein